MKDEPQAGNKGNKSEETDSHLPIAGSIGTAGITPASATNTQTQKTNAGGQKSENRMGTLKAVWYFIANCFRVVIGFLDKNSGAVTAIATIAIAYLTWQYVTYSKKQWETMQGQSSIIQRQLRDSEQVQIARLEVDATPLEKPGILKAIADKRSDSILIDWTVKVTNLGPTIARALNFTAEASTMANTHGEFNLDEKSAHMFSAISPNPSPFGRILKVADNADFPFKAQIPGLNNIVELRDSLIIMMQVSYIDVFDQPQGVPDCVYYSVSQNGFVQCPLIVHEVPPKQEQRSGANK